MDNKVRLQFPKTQSDAEDKAIEDAVFILTKAGFEVDTENTAGTDVEGYDANPNEFTLTEAQDKFINEFIMQAKELGLELKGGYGAVVPSQGF